MVYAGQERLSLEVAAEIAEHSADDALTPREVDVLRLVAKGNANKGIAARLLLTEETIKSPFGTLFPNCKRTTRPTPSQ